MRLVPRSRVKLSLAVVVLLVALCAMPRAGFAAVLGVPQREQADMSGPAPSADTRRVVDWVVASNDNRDLPFIIVDKVNAELFLFDRSGSIRAATSVLLGLARGDDSPPGIGERKLSMISPAERITPAGRFVAAPGKNLAGQDIIWIDYAAAVALHRATDVVSDLSAEDRMARLASASPGERRITHGCINVSPAFYEQFVQSTFRTTTGIVYVLPETRSVDEVFHMSTSN